MKTIIVGLGNSILSDDSVGIKTASQVKERVGVSNEIDFLEIGAGGLRLMEAISGYNKAIIIDAMEKDPTSPGKIYKLTPDDFTCSKNISCKHDTSFIEALKIGNQMGVELPTEIKIWAIEAKNVTTFSEELTEEVAKSVPLVVDDILEEINN